MRRVIFSTVISIILILLAGCQAAAPVVPTSLPAIDSPTSQSAATNTPAATIIPTSTSTPTETPCRESNGAILDIEIPTSQLKHPVGTKVYLPPCYDENAASGYPVLYMLHGQAATNDQWVRLGLTAATDELINQGKIQPTIIVMPFEITWTPGPEGSYFDEALVGDVIPYIDANYATCTGRSCRAVGGLSRGGNWAVYLGFAYPELFGVVGAHSTPLFYGEELRISQALGESATVDDLPYILMDMGSKDDDRAFVQAFRAFLEEKGIPFAYHEFDGRHEESYWSAHVSDYLQWYAERLIIPGDA